MSDQTGPASTDATIEELWQAVGLVEEIKIRLKEIGLFDDLDLKVIDLRSARRVALRLAAQADASGDAAAVQAAREVVAGVNRQLAELGSS